MTNTSKYAFVIKDGTFLYKDKKIFYVDTYKEALSFLSSQRQECDEPLFISKVELEYKPSIVSSKTVLNADELFDMLTKIGLVVVVTSQDLPNFSKRFETVLKIKQGSEEVASFLRTTAIISEKPSLLILEEPTRSCVRLADFVLVEDNGFYTVIKNRAKDGYNRSPLLFSLEV